MTKQIHIQLNGKYRRIMDDIQENTQWYFGNNNELIGLVLFHTWLMLKQPNAEGITRGECILENWTKKSPSEVVLDVMRLFKEFQARGKLPEYPTIKK